MIQNTVIKIRYFGLSQRWIWRVHCAEMWSRHCGRETPSFRRNFLPPTSTLKKNGKSTASLKHSILSTIWLLPWERQSSIPAYLRHSLKITFSVKVSYLPTDAKWSSFKRLLKFTSKQLLHVSVQSSSSSSSGNVSFEVAKVTLIKIIS